MAFFSRNLLFLNGSLVALPQARAKTFLTHIACHLPPLSDVAVSYIEQIHLTARVTCHYRRENCTQVPATTDVAPSWGIAQVRCQACVRRSPVNVWTLHHALDRNSILCCVANVLARGCRLSSRAGTKAPDHLVIERREFLFAFRQSRSKPKPTKSILPALSAFAVARILALARWNSGMAGARSSDAQSAAGCIGIWGYPHRNKD
jgi:hypothetical protein